MTTKIEEIEQELDKAIGATNEPKDRAMLMLIQKILLHVEKLLDDEESLRNKVFNGNYVTHNSDHDLIEDLRVLNAVDSIKWVNNRMNHGGHCLWVEKKIEQEKESSKHWKEKVNDFLYESAKNSLYLILGMVIYAAANGFPLLSKILG